MSLKASAHTRLAGSEHARNIYLTAFWRITPAALVILSMLVVACGPGRPPATTSAPPAGGAARPSPSPTSGAALKKTPTRAQTRSPTLAVKALDLRGMQVRFWYVRPGGIAGEGQVERLVDEFNRSNTWGITVTAVPYESYEALYQQVDTPQGDDVPDLLAGYSYQLRGLDRDGSLLADLSPYIQDPLWGLSAEEQAGFNPLFWQQDVVAGKRLGLPFFRTAQVLYYNLSQAKELGFISAPETPVEFAAQACAAAQANRRQEDEALHGTGGWAVSTDVPTMEGWLYAFGSAITSQEAPSYALSTTQTTQAFIFLKGLFDKGCAWSAEAAFPSKEFVSRQAIFISGSLAGLDTQAEAFRAASNKDAWTVLPFLSPRGRPVVPAYGPSFAVLKSSPEKQAAAWLFARWAINPQNQARWIEDSASLPLGEGVLPLLAAYKSGHPQWAAALELLPEARLEPSLASWSEVRWALSDAGGRLFSPLFPADLIPQMVGMLSDTAAELDARPR